MEQSVLSQAKLKALYNPRVTQQYSPGVFLVITSPITIRASIIL